MTRRLSRPTGSASSTDDAGRSTTAPWPYPKARSSGSSDRTGRAKPPCCTLPSDCSHQRRASITVLGGHPGDGPAQLAQVGFVAQDTPTYAGLSVAKHLRMGAFLIRHWDDEFATSRIEQLGLDPRQRAGTLSGGERAQLALTLATAKRPELLLLDEPVASLDPLARREFLQGLMEVVAGHEVSVVLSSHLVADLERVCDYLVVLVASHVQLSGEVTDLLASHHRLYRAAPGPEHPAEEPGGHRAESHRQAEHAPRANRRGRSSTPHGT